MKNIFKRWLTKSNFKSQNNNHNNICVIWIHGANQSGLSFRYLRSVTRFENELVVEYDTANKFYDNLGILRDKIKYLAGPYFIIGHSLGGLYALHLTKYLNIAGAVSISTPFAGSWTADWARFFVPKYQLFRDVGRRSTAIKESKEIAIKFKWTQIVSTKGNVPYHGGQNDGVCTVESMKSREDMELIEVPHTHFEVMCSDVVGEIILKRYDSAFKQSSDLVKNNDI